MNSRERTEEIEELTLHPKAALARKSRGRLIKEIECDVRTCYQRDRDRIVHSKAFRRLKHKTQVFLAPEGDHYRTRLTHVLEVSQIARTIARALRLNEDLVEAISLGHDLGHTPFGHAGESVLRELNPKGFRHYQQSLRVVDCLEKNGKGLNLTEEVRDGILKHSKGKGQIINDKEMPITLEGIVVRVADIVAYVNHDLDDAMRAGLLTQDTLPQDVIATIGSDYSRRIDAMVRDVIDNTIKSDYQFVGPSNQMQSVIYTLRDFLYERVYENRAIIQEFQKARSLLKEIYCYYRENIALLLEGYANGCADDPDTIVTDFVSGMTDRFALATYERLFMPHQWKIV
jgi:dGTPase